MSSRFGKSALLFAFLWAIGLSYGVSDWAIYRSQVLAHPDGWKMYLHGGIESPFQYRIGSWILVDWMNRLFDVKPYNTLAAVDVLCLVLALWILLRILRDSDQFKSMPVGTQWLSIVGVLFLVEYYLAWGHWFQAPETLPSVLFVALSVALIYGKIVKNQHLSCAILICLSLIQGFFRADVAVILHGGIFLAIVFNRNIVVPLGRFQQAGTSLLAAFIAGCIQLYLMFVRFPAARYGAGGALRLHSNLHPEMWLAMLLALFPYFVLLGFMVAKRDKADPPTICVVFASLLYLALWATVGLLDEVRIFLPFSITLAPVTTLALIGVIPENNYETPKLILP